MNIKTELRNEGLRNIVRLMQQKEMSSMELVQIFNLSMVTIRGDIRVIRSEVEIEEIQINCRDLKYRISSNVDPDKLFRAEMRNKGTKREPAAKYEDISQAMKNDFLGKKKVYRSDVIDWYLKRFKGNGEITTLQLTQMLTKTGVTVIKA